MRSKPQGWGDSGGGLAWWAEGTRGCLWAGIVPAECGGVAGSTEAGITPCV